MTTYHTEKQQKVLGGTFANSRKLQTYERVALDEVGEELGRYIRLCNYCSGLCMPEIASMGALEKTRRNA